MNRLIIVGSPRVDGRSAHLADLLFESCIAAYPDDEVALAPVSTLDIAPCRGCDACKALAERSADAAGDGLEGADVEAFVRCVVDDDMAQLYELIDAADEVVVVSPVYFAGAPAQLKALLDRLQPYFWIDARIGPKRPATLHVVGEGGDPHGFEPLVGVVRSALSCAGFSLERVLDWVGKIDEEGEITAEAVEHPVAPLPGGSGPTTGGRDGEAGREPDAFAVAKAAAPSASAKVRPELRLSSNGEVRQGADKAPAKSGGGKRHASGSGAPGSKRPKQGSGRQGGRTNRGGKRRG